MIEIKGLSYKIRKKEILKDIHVSFAEGIYGLLGPNGAGKTTFLRCVTGVYKAPQNTVFVEGKDITTNPDYVQRLGYLPQKFGLYKNMTVYQMLQLFAEIRHIPKEKQDEAIMNSLEAVRLKERKNDQIGTLSGGMIRRIGIAQALIGDPKILLFDEPTAGLDPEERIHFKNIISALSKKNILVIISTHIVEDVSFLCDHIIIMKEGSVAAKGSGSEIAAFADGMVYQVSEDRSAELAEPYLITGKMQGGIRLLSPVRQPGAMLKPEIEDGYLCKVKGFADSSKREAKI